MRGERILADAGTMGWDWWGTLPAVRTVFFMDCIIRLSPEACSRTLVRSSGLDHRECKP